MTSLTGRRGRDPEQHLVHESRAAADRYKGMHGELTFVAEGNEEGAALVEIRAHNGLQYGGFSVPVVQARDNLASTLPLARVVPPIEVTTTVDPEVVPISHELGYFPIVQVLDNTGQVVPGALIVHDDAENVSVTIPTAGDYTVVLR